MKNIKLMQKTNYEINGFVNSIHREQVIELWENIFSYGDPHNAPEIVIDKKLKNKDKLFYVAEENHRIIGTIMAGYDGHRGWIYSVAVHPDYQKQGIGSALLSFTHKKLKNLGCLKINLQIMGENEAVQKFYLSNGYSVEQRISMGRKLY
jgi:ribosomal protein S18 acetylase RimI-like enzyme